YTHVIFYTYYNHTLTTEIDTLSLHDAFRSSRWITASSSWKRFCLFVCRALSSIMVICMLTAIRLLLTFVMSLYLLLRRSSLMAEIGRAVQQECRDRSRMPSSA